MKRFLGMVIGLALICNVSYAQGVKEQFPNAMEFAYSELDINKGVIKSIEFDKYKCNLTLKNTDDSKKDVDVMVLVLNEDGVILWQKTEYWLMSSLEPGQKYTADWDFKPSIPVELEFSKYASISSAPKWVVVLYKPPTELKNKFNPLLNK